jgi:hypothetical protein
MKSVIRGVLVLWLVAVFLVGAVGMFERPPGTPPIPILIGAAGPLVVFLAAYWGSARFRAFVLAIDLPLATAIQAWRAGGLAFLALYAHGLLPGVFAWPAGLGDIAIGVTAPWVAIALVRRPGFVTHRVFVVWNLLGDPRPRRRGEHRRAEFGAGLWRRRGSDERADGAVATGVDPCLLRAVVHHAALGRTLSGATARPDPAFEEAGLAWRCS